MKKISSVSNYTLLNKALHFFLEMHTKNNSEDTTTETSNTEQCKAYLYCDKSNTNEDIALVTNSALRNIVYGVQEHANTCKRFLDVTDIMLFGHIAKLILRCSEEHSLRCDTSPHIEGGKFLANLRMALTVQG